jgi:hypothetical protein
MSSYILLKLWVIEKYYGENSLHSAASTSGAGHRPFQSHRSNGAGKNHHIDGDTKSVSAGRIYLMGGGHGPDHRRLYLVLPGRSK